MTQLNGKCFKRTQVAILAILLAGMLLLCGCAGRGSDAYFFDQAETAEETESAQGVETQIQDPLDDASAGEMAALGAPDTADAAEAQETGQDDAADTQAVCMVHICGAVQNPGVYALPEGSRVMDAVEAGGGFLEDADPAACNLAQPVVDGCQIYIMTLEESAAADGGGRSAGIQEATGLSGNASAAGAAGTNGSSAMGTASESGDGKVNINTADAATLKTLPGIGDSRAAAIIAYREEHGSFSGIEDIMKVSGIKEAAFEKIKDRITV